MKKSLTLIMVSVIFLQNCKEDCYVNSEPTVFEFVNSSGENLIQNGTLTSAKIVVQQDNGNGNFAGIKIEVREDKRVLLKNVGLFDGTRDYNVYLNADPVRTFSFKISSEKLTGDCDGYKINDLTLENITWSADNGYYKIVID
ncbi:hypothetical protein [Chryseobacterium tongliaoense]|uniref:hypothetical protein n=1 Tax=Chryseobacterium tongliaoense TaxID=3240933 RepID=UPI003512F320